MTFDNEKPYLDYTFDENFIEWYDFEGPIQITEHSRQIRTLLNYKCATIKYFYRPSTKTSFNGEISKFLEQKNELESLGLHFIKIVKKMKNLTGNIEEGIQIIQNQVLGRDQNAKALLYELKDITDKLFTKIHYFSEQDIHKFPRFLMLIIRITYNACIVQKYLKNKFSDFYQELGKNYSNLENELMIMKNNQRSKDNRQSKIKNVKQLGEPLL